MKTLATVVANCLCPLSLEYTCFAYQFQVAVLEYQWQFVVVVEVQLNMTGGGNNEILMVIFLKHMI